MAGENGEEEDGMTLTVMDLENAMRKLDEIGPPPIIFVFSWAVPYDQVFYGEAINKMATALGYKFNPEKQKVYLVSKRWEEELQGGMFCPNNWRMECRV